MVGASAAEPSGLVPVVGPANPAVTRQTLHKAVQGIGTWLLLTLMDAAEDSRDALRRSRRHEAAAPGHKPTRLWGPAALGIVASVALRRERSPVE
jgi:hypothetical protein